MAESSSSEAAEASSLVVAEASSLVAAEASSSVATEASSLVAAKASSSDPEHHQHFLKENQQAGGRPQKVVSVPASPVPPVPSTHTHSAYQPPHTSAN